ncbi:GNAT family N-acetyltransferase [Terrarubrum flagellatum]|uniref:GNAT family N-acetyltransferase n=1 Tax=Terrirubrum flagellatum TaxID=2895980 RepID=UPI003145567B
MRLTELSTERLRLEPVALTHAAGLFPLLNNWEVVRWLGRPSWPARREDMEAFFVRAGRANEDGSEATAAIIFEGRAVGVIGLDQRRGAWHIGYWLGQDYWGRGVMSEAVEAMLNFFFSTRDDLFLMSGVIDGNAASLRIQKKMGFVQVGESMIDSNPHGRRVGHIETLLGREAWRRRQIWAGLFI